MKWKKDDQRQLFAERKSVRVQVNRLEDITRSIRKDLVVDGINDHRKEKEKTTAGLTMYNYASRPSWGSSETRDVMI
jgi:hypothetical protein